MLKKQIWQFILLNNIHSKKPVNKSLLVAIYQFSDD